MPATHELIQVQTASGGGSTTALEFTAIPQTFTDLELVWSLKYNSYNPTSASYSNTFWRVNGDSTSSVYPFMYGGMMYGSGSARYYYNASTSFEILSGIGSTNTPQSACGRMMIFDYTNTATTGKSIQSRHSCIQYSGNSYDRSHMMQSGNLNIAAAVTSIKVITYNGNYIKDDSNIRLYGIDRTA
jgi:hypothetical protein